jgi:hypothetical protein
MAPNISADLLKICYRYRNSAWKNGCDTLSGVGLHENWTLALRFQVSGVRSENEKAALKPYIKLHEFGGQCHQLNINFSLKLLEIRL